MDRPIQIQPNEGKLAGITIVIPDLKDLKQEEIRKGKQAPSFSSKTVNHRNIMILNIFAPNLGTLIFIKKRKPIKLLLENNPNNCR